MKRSILTIVCVVVLLAAVGYPLFAWNSTANGDFEKANQLYRQQQYGEAASIYERLTHEYNSATLFYNLGNSYFRMGKTGEAILAFERALMRSPRNRDVRYNLNYVRSLLEYRVEDSRNWYLRAGEGLLRYFRPDEIYLMALLAYFLFIASGCFVIYFRRGLPWGWRRKTLLFITVLMFMFWGAKTVQTQVLRDAIVMAPEVEVRYGPSAADQVAFRLGEGLKVYVIDRRENWSRIILTNNESGWVRNDQIEEVAP
ncbi:tetratricopeptide repeat protein [Omnitrophica bacterium]|nr:tetratricopeptide repeat protein [Candidatus Omnitrophota bacterium]